MPGFEKTQYSGKMPPKRVKKRVFSGFEHFWPKTDPLFGTPFELNRIESTSNFKIGRFGGFENRPKTEGPKMTLFEGF